MSFDLHLKPTCTGCGSSTDLYGSNCKHMTLCLTCGKTMAENRAACYECGATVTRLIREYSVRASSSNEKNFFIGRFVTGLPNFSKKKSAENKWTLQKEGLLGRQVTDALREKYKNKPWLLEDEVSQSQYHGQLEGAQSATYYLLMLQGKEFVAIPAGSWYNFNKVATYKQLTLEEAEEKMKNRRRTADGYERWMMKAANNGPAAFGESEKILEKEAGASSGAGGRGRKKSADEEEGNGSDKEEEDEDEEAARKSRLGLNKKGVDDDDGEGRRGGDFDDDDGDIEKGDDWEHEEIFTDDDEAVGNDPAERDDLAPEVPAPPEIKQDEEDEDESNEEEGGLSKSGKELKKLLGRANGMNDSDAEDDDDSDDLEEEDRTSPVLAPKVQVTPKEEPSDNSPAKPAGKGTASSSKSAKGKRKINGDDTKAVNGSHKKVKTESEQKPSVKEEPSKASPAAKVTSSASKTGSSTSHQGPVSEDEIRAVLMQRAPVTTQDLVSRFKARLRCPEDKTAFADILKRISRISKTNGQSHIVLRDK